MRIVLDLPEGELTGAAYIEGVEEPTREQASFLRDMVIFAQGRLLIP